MPHSRSPPVDDLLRHTHARRPRKPWALSWASAVAGKWFSRAHGFPLICVAPRSERTQAMLDGPSGGNLPIVAATTAVLQHTSRDRGHGEFDGVEAWRYVMTVVASWPSRSQSVAGLDGVIEAVAGVVEVGHGSDLGVRAVMRSAGGAVPVCGRHGAAGHDWVSASDGPCGASGIPQRL